MHAKDGSAGRLHMISANSGGTITTYTYDFHNRLTNVEQGGTFIATYVYNANATTYADEANNSWVRSTDGLGRLTQVVENGIGATTQYGYDAVDDLTSVTPAAGQGRSFTYTSLKQLASATNPETSTIAYTYDANGNLLTRTDARGIVTTYCLNNNNNSVDKQETTLTHTHTHITLLYKYGSIIIITTH